MRYHRGTVGDMGMNLRLNDQEAEALQRMADATGRSQQSIAREAIMNFVTERETKMRAMLASIVDRDAEILKRLGQ
jgi:predicted transcriptional regulator